METQTIQDTQVGGKFSTELAIGSFAIGTLLFATHMALPQNIEIMVCGFIYVLVALALNVLVLLNLVYYLIILPQHREYLTIKILILLSNLPIATFYFYLVFNLF
jgi:hypothetical protein